MKMEAVDMKIVRSHILEVFKHTTRLELGAAEILGGLRLIFDANYSDFDMRNEIWRMVRDNVVEITPAFKVKVV